MDGSMTDIELIREAADILGREGLWTYGKVSALYDRADRMEAKQELIYTCSCDAYLAKIAELEAQLAELLDAHQKIISEGDYTAPEGMKRIALEAIASVTLQR